MSVHSKMITQSSYTCTVLFVLTAIVIPSSNITLQRAVQPFFFLANLQAIIELL